MATLTQPAINLTQKQRQQDKFERDRILENIMATGPERLEAELNRLKKLGVIDESGKLINADLPADMQPGAERDFGG